MSDVLIIFAHPGYQHSRVNRAMMDAARHIEGVKCHDLYELYPDFHIDVQAEQEALTHAHTLILQHPFQWYSCPALMKEWMDIVLLKGWAYGEGGTALEGKRWLSAITTGGPEHAYQSKGYNRFRMEELLIPFHQTAHLCGMEYLPPFLFHDALSAGHDNIADHAERYAALLHRLAMPVATRERLRAHG